MDLQERLFKAVNEADAVRAAFLRYLQHENQCTYRAGIPCDPQKCGCAIEMQDYIDAVPK